MDLARIARELEIDESEYITLLDLFVTHTAADLESLTRAHAASKLDEVYRAAHSIKGASANLGLWSIQEAAADVCAEVKQGNAENVAPRLETIESELETIKQILNQRRGEIPDGA